MLWYTYFFHRHTRTSSVCFTHATPPCVAYHIFFHKLGLVSALGQPGLGSTRRAGPSFKTMLISKIEKGSCLEGTANETSRCIQGAKKVALIERPRSFNTTKKGFIICQLEALQVFRLIEKCPGENDQKNTRSGNH